MARPFLLRVEMSPEGGLSVVGWSGVGRPVAGVLPPGALAPALTALGEMAVAAAEGLPRSDAWWSRIEGECGAGLGAVWRAAAGLGEAFAAWLAAAGPSPTLLVDPVATEHLPWELLVGPDGSPLEGSRKLLVARLGGGPAAWAGEASSSVRAWSPTPAEPSCASLLTDLKLPVEATDEPGLLVLVAHGRVARGRATIELGEGLGGTDLIPHLLGGALQRVGLVAACICESGHALGGELDALPGRLLRAGASACLAPSAPLHREVARAVALALAASWKEGCSVASAVLAARAQARGLALQTLDGRWHNLRLHVADPLALGRGVASSLGWAACAGPTAMRCLRRAEEIARGHGAAAVGVEHVMSALTGLDPVSPGVARVRAALPPDRLDKLMETELVVTGPLPERPLPTPRLGAMIANLGAGFTLDALVDSIVADPDHRLHRAARSPLRAAWPNLANRSNPTLHTVFGSVPATGVPALLQVVGGPEDGRLIRPSPGDVLGRAQAATGAQIGLYASVPLSDPKLSRRAFRWDGEGRVDLASRAIVLRAGQRVQVEAGAAQLLVGDTLLLTGETRLLLLGGEGR